MEWRGSLSLSVGLRGSLWSGEGSLYLSDREGLCGVEGGLCLCLRVERVSVEWRGSLSLSVGLRGSLWSGRGSLYLWD